MPVTFSVANKSCGAVCVFIDDELIFRDVLPEENTRKNEVCVGTRQLLILNSREKIIADILFSAQKNTHTTLYIGDGDVYFTQTPFPGFDEEPSSQSWKPAPEKLR